MTSSVCGFFDVTSANVCSRTDLFSRKPRRDGGGR